MKSITHDEELIEMKAYMHQIFMRPASGEYALNTILMPGSWAKNPLIHRLPCLQVPVAFYYGERDWMDPYPAMQLIEENLLPSGAKLHVIDDSDHHLYLDNPVDMVYKILLEVFGQEVS
jgi:cardiolipin-specific phospholipase